MWISNEVAFFTPYPLQLQSWGYSVFNSIEYTVTDGSQTVCSPGGVLRFDLDRGVPLEPQNSYSSLRVILAEKGTQF